MGSVVREDVQATVEIRPLAADELDAVEQTLARYPGKHRERLEGQRRGECVYLIAWDGAEPVGHLNLRLRGRKLPTGRDAYARRRSRICGWRARIADGDSPPS